MKVSVNWIRSLNDQYQCAAEPAPDGIEKLVEKIGYQLGAVDKVIDFGKRYKDIVIVKVVECKKHPNADKLSVCLVDDGKVTKKIDRGINGLIEVVCGAPNVKAGVLAAWIPPGATVPSTYDKEPFMIERREIRGIISNGMLASPKELGIGDDHSGILEIDKNAEPGDSFAELYRMDDYVIDIENKMFTHRPDLFGHIGIAREIAGIQHQVFKSPDWYKEDASITTDGRSNGLKLQVKNDLPDLVPRFCALVVKDVKIGPSPAWLRASLSRVGIKSINNIVDLTNFYMLLTAQPLHAYDADKLRQAKSSKLKAESSSKDIVLGIRLSKKGEQLKLLGGKQLKLDDGAIVVTDGKKPIGLGGVMGGADTEVDESTHNIILECATFDMNITRKTMMSYGIFTDAAARFTKNQSPRQNRAVIAKAADDIVRIAGGKICGPIVDVLQVEALSQPIEVSAEFINNRLGTSLSAAEMKKLLTNVEFKVDTKGDKLSIIVPFWRTDIEIAEDIVEEVGRLYGYDHLPLALPPRDLAPAAKNTSIDFKNRLRGIMIRAGGNEVLTYSFVNEHLLKAVGQDPAKAFHIRNALSPDLQYYRMSLIPSLLEKIHPNLKAGFDKFALFEIGKGHDKAHIDKAGLPEEFELLALACTANTKAKPGGAAFFQAKDFLNYLANELKVTLIFTPAKELPEAPRTKIYEPKRSAMVTNKDGKYLGMIGELQPSVRQQLKLPEFTAAFEINITELQKSVPLVKSYTPLSRFPATSQDLCLRTGTRLSYQRLTDYIHAYLDQATDKDGYLYRLEALDIYSPDMQSDYKQTTWRIHLWHPKRTLTTKEANRLIDSVVAKAKQGFKAERI